jgi:hypothetical protein
MVAPEFGLIGGVRVLSSKGSSTPRDFVKLRGDEEVLLAVDRLDLCLVTIPATFEINHIERQAKSPIC